MSRVLRHLIPWAVVLAFVRPSHAAPPLTLDEVIRAVEQSHPQLESADQEIERADGQAVAAQGGFDPNLSLRTKWTPIGYYNHGQVDAMVRQPTPVWGVGLYAGYRIGWGNYPVYKGELQTQSGGEVRAGIDIPIWRNGPIDPRRAAIKQAKIERRASRVIRDATQLELERDAAHAFWTWVAAGQGLGVTRDLLTIAERRDAGLHQQANAGAIERITLVDNQRLVLDRRAKVVAAERKFQESSLKLSLFLRNRDRVPVRVGEDRVPEAFPPPMLVDTLAVESEVEQAMGRRPDVAALVAQRQISAVDVQLARNRRAPAMNVQSFVSRDFGSGPPELGPTEWGAAVVIEVPLLLRTARGEYRAAKAELAAVNAKMRGLSDAVAVEVRMALVGLQATRLTVDLARQQVSTAEELAVAERTRFKQGASDLVTVNLREIAAASAAIQEIEALADYQRAYADFMVATGRSPARSSPGGGP